MLNFGGTKRIIGSAFLLLSTLGFASTAFATNNSQSFTTCVAQSAGRDPQFTQGLQQYNFLFVRGFLNDSPVNPDYFPTQFQLFNQLGLTYASTASISDQSIPKNAATLRGYIYSYADTKPLIIISHSRGSLITLEALSTLPKEQRKKVRAFISIQGPFWGSPAADLADSLKGLVSISAPLLTYLGTNSQVIFELTTYSRTAWMMQNQASVRDSIDDVTTVTYGSSLKSLEPFDLNLVNSGSIQFDGTDGFVSKNSASLGMINNSARTIFENGVGHSDLVTQKNLSAGAVEDRTLCLIQEALK